MESGRFDARHVALLAAENRVSQSESQEYSTAHAGDYRRQGWPHI